MKTKKRHSDDYYLKILQGILDESFTIIETMIKGKDQLLEVGFNVDKLETFRDFIEAIYFLQINTNVLRNITKDNIILFLDKGLIIEDSVNYKLNMLRFKISLEKDIQEQKKHSEFFNQF